MMNIIISVNPKAGRRSPMLRAEELCGRRREKGFQPELLTSLDEVTEKAKAYHAEARLRALVGVGGDGTAATLVNRTEPGTPITLLSAGTANLLAKHFRLGKNPRQLAEMIETGQLLTLDAGLAIFNGGEKLFLVMVSCGFDADIVSGVHTHREERYRQGHKKGAHISYLSYINPVCRSLCGYRFPKMNVEVLNIDGNVTESIAVDDQIRMAFFFNINRYAWGLPLAPYADPGDGKLDHILFRGGSVFHGAVYTLFAQCFSLHRILPGVKIGQATRYRITSDQPVPFQLDGDPGGTLPLEVEIVPNRFTFLVPKR
jgi:diacylglycerol kinase family enzyme